MLFPKKILLKQTLALSSLRSKHQPLNSCISEKGKDLQQSETVASKLSLFQSKAYFFPLRSSNGPWDEVQNITRDTERKWYFYNFLVWTFSGVDKVWWRSWGKFQHPGNWYSCLCQLNSFWLRERSGLPSLSTDWAQVQGAADTLHGPAGFWPADILIAFYFFPSSLVRGCLKDAVFQVYPEVCFL